MELKELMVFYLEKFTFYVAIKLNPNIADKKYYPSMHGP